MKKISTFAFCSAAYYANCAINSFCLVATVNRCLTYGAEKKPQKKVPSEPVLQHWKRKNTTFVQNIYKKHKEAVFKEIISCCMCDWTIVVESDLLSDAFIIFKMFVFKTSSVLKNLQIKVHYIIISETICVNNGLPHANL